MIMNKLFITGVLMLAALMSAAAAEPTSDRRTELAQKEGRLFADKLGLDDSTAEKFIKIFVENQQEKWALQPRKQRHKNRVDRTDAQIDSAINAQFDNSQKLLDMRKKYYKQYRKLLTARQVQMLYDQESKMNTRMRGANADMQRKRAEMRRKQADIQRKKADVQRKRAEMQRDKQRKRAEQQRARAEKAKKAANEKDIQQ